MSKAIGVESESGNFSLHYHNDGEQIEDGANGPNGDAEVPTPSLLAFPQHIVFAGSTFAVFFVVLFFRN